jgi:glycosyltransferase involved in cell wall biosynthesis
VRNLNVVVIAGAWGYRHGGINALNKDLCTALHSTPGIELKCVCLEERGNAAREVAPPWVLQLDADPPAKYLIGAPALVQQYSRDLAWYVRDALQREHVASVDWYVGHDLVTGELAAALRELDRGGLAIFAHMRRLDYALSRHPSQRVDIDDRAQKRLYQSADVCFAVGPLLYEELGHQGVKNVVEIVPGLAKRTSAQKPTKHAGQLNAITFGRLDDPVKQAKLAVRAFGRACTHIEPRSGPPTLRLLGVTDDKDAQGLRELAQKEAKKQRVNVLGLPYEPDRTKLEEALDDANLAIIVPEHEAFGLTAWEAIGHRVPLILSTSSGVHRLLEREKQTDRILSIKVMTDDSGEPQDPVIEGLADAISTVAGRLNAHIDTASVLYDALAAKYSWEAAAGSLLRGLTEATMATASRLPAPEVAATGPSRPRGGSNATKQMDWIRSMACYNQTMVVQGVALGRRYHEDLVAAIYTHTGDEPQARAHKLQATLGDIVRQAVARNFAFLSEHFADRHDVAPRLCVKLHRRDDQIEVLFRDREESEEYTTQHRLGQNTAFASIIEDGRYYLCNDIPSAAADGKYLNTRLDIEKVRGWVSDDGSQSGVAWKHLWSGPGQGDGRAFYKSTLVVPMTYFGDLRPDFVEMVRRRPGVGGRYIHGYVCADHVSTNFFEDPLDVDVLYVVADAISTYVSVWQAFTRFSPASQSLDGGAKAK